MGGRGYCGAAGSVRLLVYFSHKGFAEPREEFFSKNSFLPAAGRRRYVLWNDGRFSVRGYSVDRGALESFPLRAQSEAFQHLIMARK